MHSLTSLYTLRVKNSFGSVKPLYCVPEEINRGTKQVAPIMTFTENRATAPQEGNGLTKTIGPLTQSLLHVQKNDISFLFLSF